MRPATRCCKVMFPRILPVFIPLFVEAALLTVPSAGSELPIRTSLVEGRSVLLLPSDVAELSIIAPSEGVKIEIVTAPNRRTYRATYRGRTYTAHADVSGHPTRFAFDPTQRRFQVVTSTIRVELSDYDDLERIVAEYDAIWGKAYPQLDFALIRLEPEKDPGRAAELLGLDPRVKDAELQFRGPVRRPMGLAESRTRPPGFRSGEKALGNAMSSSAAGGALEISGKVVDAGPDFEVEIIVSTSDSEQSPAATLDVILIAVDESEQLPYQEDIPALFAGDKFSTTLAFDTPDLSPGQTYLLLARVVHADTEVPPDYNPIGPYGIGFTLDSLGRVQHACIDPGRPRVSGTDPLLPGQWHLRNIGQRAYAESGGVAGEDLRMQGVLASGPTGKGVRVAVVDSGMETCHPDLRANVEEGASFNFLTALLVASDPSTRSRIRAEARDPFNYNPHGDHGTAMAGLIAAEANNGRGGRGVAPEALLRGYNVLALDPDLHALDPNRAFLDSLGASYSHPDSTD